jgi:hypothetical protein
MELTLAQRKAITKAQLAKWPKATRTEKSAILDAVCEVSGWHRDHARKAIRTALAGKQATGPRQPREVIEAAGKAMQRKTHHSSQVVAQQPCQQGCLHVRGAQIHALVFHQHHHRTLLTTNQDALDLMTGEHRICPSQQCRFRTVCAP